MTVGTTSNIITEEGDGGNTSWPFPFAVIEASNLVVSVTDVDGNVSVIPSSNYTTVINSPIPPNPTPIGGTITYPLSGSPLTAGEQLTIQRILPLTQPTAFSNQGTIYPQVVEQALDRLEMEMQQVEATHIRAIVVAVSDPDPNPLPAAAQRANKLMGFDVDGNPIAVEITDAGVVMVSSVMIPVVEAATLASARTELGLGDMAVESIGAGLQDDGADNVRVNSEITADSINQAVVAAFHQTQRIAVNAITYTLAKANTLWNGFCFYGITTSGLVTISPNASDSVGNLAAGASFYIQPNSFFRITTDGALTWWIEVHALGNFVTSGAAVINGYLTESRAAGAATIALKTLSGNDPSSMEPVYIAFRSSTVGSGTVTVRVVTAPLAITITSTATMGFTNSIPGRLWITALDNAGTVELAVVNCLIGLSIYPLQGWGIVSTTAMTAGSDSAGVMYSASARAGVAYATLGYMTWEAGLAVAGTWDAAPTRIQLAGYGVPLPGMRIQELIDTDSAAATGTTVLPVDNTIPQNTEGDEYLSTTIAPTSTANILDFEWMFACAQSTGGQVAAALFQGATVNAIASVPGVKIADNAVTTSAGRFRKQAGTTSSTAFALRIGPASAATLTFNGQSGAGIFNGTIQSQLRVAEIMA